MAFKEGAVGQAHFLRNINFEIGVVLQDPIFWQGFWDLGPIWALVQGLVKTITYYKALTACRGVDLVCAHTTKSHLGPQ